MWSEILKIKPQLDNGDMSRMESTLTARFGRVAKKFGKGLGASLLGGGLAGAALGILDKILNPLKETQDAIDRTLAKADNVVTNANAFETSAGKLFVLQNLAKSQGLNEDSLYMLIQKYQTAVAEARKDPTKDTSVRQFVGIKDTAEGFFQYIQALQKLPKDLQVLAQAEVFGEKQILKLAEFLQTDFPKQMKAIGARPADQYEGPLNQLEAFEGLQRRLEAKREGNDIFRKAEVINGDFILQQHRAEQLKLDRENERISAYRALANMDAMVTKVVAMFEKQYIEILKIASSSNNIAEAIIKIDISNLRFLRGIVTGNKDN